MIEKSQEIKQQNDKYKNLILSILFDGIGFLSFSILGIGEFSDIVWAPIAGYLMTRMYKGTIGKVGGVIAFLEEIIPFSDFIPTFTLIWIYTYWIKKQNVK